MEIGTFQPKLHLNALTIFPKNTLSKNPNKPQKTRQKGSYFNWNMILINPIYSTFKFRAKQNLKIGGSGKLWFWIPWTFLNKLSELLHTITQEPEVTDLVSIKIRITHIHQACLVFRVHSTVSIWSPEGPKNAHAHLTMHPTMSEANVLQRINSNIQQVKIPDLVAFLILTGCVFN